MVGEKHRRLSIYDKQIFYLPVQKLRGKSEKNESISNLSSLNNKYPTICNMLSYLNNNTAMY